MKLLLGSCRTHLSDATEEDEDFNEGGLKSESDGARGGRQDIVAPSYPAAVSPRASQAQ